MSLTKPSLKQVRAPFRRGTVAHDGHKLDLSSTPIQKISDGYFDQDQSKLILQLSNGSVASIDGFISEADLPTGISGLTGGRGRQGSDGRSGKTGFIGTIGERGSEGIQGTMGPTGPRGNIGPTGPVGFTGPKGPRGNAGRAGRAGQDGDVNVAISYVDPGDSLGPKSLWITPNGGFPETSGDGCTVYSAPCWVERFEPNCQTNDLPETTQPPPPPPPPGPQPTPPPDDPCEGTETVIYFCVDGSGSMTVNDDPARVPTFVSQLIDQCEAKYDNPTYMYACSLQEDSSIKETTDENEVRAFFNDAHTKYYGNIYMDAFIKTFWNSTSGKAKRDDVNPVYIFISDEIATDVTARAAVIAAAQAADIKLHMIYINKFYEGTFAASAIAHYKKYADDTGGNFLVGDSATIGAGTGSFLTAAVATQCAGGGGAPPPSGTAAPPPPPPPPPPATPCSGDCRHCMKLTRFPGGEVKWDCSNSLDNPNLSVGTSAFGGDTGFKLEIILDGRFEGQYSYLIGPWGQAGGVHCRGGARKPTPNDWSGTDWDKIISRRWSKQVMYGCPLESTHGNLTFSYRNTVNLF